MSDPVESPAAARIFRPETLLAGFAAGLALLAWKGREVAREDWHTGFTRFHPMISPAAMYEPTVTEMCSIVRSRCRPDQVLVIVGGNSIFLGVGQPVEKVWTRALQENLGDRFVVINFAFRGSFPVEGGAVVAEALRKEFPRLIYVANEIPLQAAGPTGSDTYRFMLLDAYYKGLLAPWPPRDRALARMLWTLDSRDFPRMEAEVGAKLDALLYFHSFWNWWSFTKGFTFATTLMPSEPQAHFPRNHFKDEETDFETIPFETRFTPQVVATDMNITRQYTASYYDRNPDGSWSLNKTDYQAFMDNARSEFPDEVKPRTLIVISRNSPYFTRQLEPEIRARDEDAVRVTIAGWKSLGYDSIDYGRDFEDEDYGDRTHLTATGGAKLAAVLAPEIQGLAVRLNYVPR